MGENHYIEHYLKATTDVSRSKNEIAFLSVSGMGYPNCAVRIRNNLLSLNGVIHADVDRANGIAEVSFNPELVCVEMLLKAVTCAGNEGGFVYSARFVHKEALP